jgi:hypothetical protein
LAVLPLLRPEGASAHSACGKVAWSTAGALGSEGDSGGRAAKSDPDRRVGGYFPPVAQPRTPKDRKCFFRRAVTWADSTVGCGVRDAIPVVGGHAGRGSAWLHQCRATFDRSRSRELTGFDPFGLYWRAPYPYRPRHSRRQRHGRAPRRSPCAADAGSDRHGKRGASAQSQGCRDRSGSHQAGRVAPATPRIVEETKLVLAKDDSQWAAWWEAIPVEKDGDRPLATRDPS